MNFTHTSTDGTRQELFEDGPNVAEAIAIRCCPYTPRKAAVAAIKAAIKLMKTHHAKSVDFVGGKLELGDHMNDVEDTTDDSPKSYADTVYDMALDACDEALAKAYPRPVLVALTIKDRNHGDVTVRLWKVVINGDDIFFDHFNRVRRVNDLPFTVKDTKGVQTKLNQYLSRTMEHTTPDVFVTA